ncbi:MAG: iron-containing redox enzyme family protein [Deltaproteobacteria bacterium]|nr:iron-containing redox enzyme family protein [Deltaproteobacteria bacterium]
MSASTHPAFAPHVVDRLRAVTTPRWLGVDECLIQEGALDTTLYYVEHGRLRVETQERGVFAEVGAGNVVGEYAFLDDMPRSARVFAAEPTCVLPLRREDVRAALGDVAGALEDFTASLVNRVLARLGSASGATLASDFLTNLESTARTHRAVRHPYLTALATGDVPDLHGALRDFATQYYGYSAHFPRYLTVVISRLEVPEHRAALIENLTEESGHYSEDDLAELAKFGVHREWIEGIAHPILFRRFRTAMGVAEASRWSDEIEVVNWREMFLSVLTSGSPAEAIGALGLGTEGIVRDVYCQLTESIDRLGLPASDTVFFPLHTAVDDHHQETLRDIAMSFATTPSDRRDLAKGMRKALALRAGFWDWMLERARAMDVTRELRPRRGMRPAAPWMDVGQS